jgi:hypothetical protein
MPFSEATKLTVKKKADFTCCWCNDRQNKVEVHHIIPQADDGTDDIDNAAPLCGSCHDLYGGNPDLRKEIRSRREQWYEICVKSLNPVYGWPIGQDVPLLAFHHGIPLSTSITTAGVQFTDKEIGNPDNPPLLYLTVHFKESRYFGRDLPAENEKWLYLEANMRFAFSLRIQVRAWNMRDVHELLDVLRGEVNAYNLHGPRPSDSQAGDYLYIGREDEEHRLIMSTFTASNAAVSIHARLSDDVAQAFVDYLETIGYSSEF